MLIARRGVLRAGAALGAALLAGCTSRRGGSPVPAPSTGSPPTGSTESSSGAGSSGRLRLGVAEYRPYAYRADAGLTGEVVEVAKAACARLDAELDVVIVPYDGLRPTLEAGGVDAAGALRLAPTNCAWVDHYVPDHLSNLAIAMPAGNPLGLRTIAEVRDKQARLAVLANSTDLTFARAAGVATIEELPTAEVALAAVTDDQVDCFLYDDITLHDLVAARSGLTVGPSFAPPDGASVYGFGFAPEHGAVAESFAEALAGLRASGEWERIARPFGFTERNVLPAEDAEKTCE